VPCIRPVVGNLAVDRMAPALAELHVEVARRMAEVDSLADSLAVVEGIPVAAEGSHQVVGHMVVVEGNLQAVRHIAVGHEEVAGHKGLVEVRRSPEALGRMEVVGDSWVVDRKELAVEDRVNVLVVEGKENGLEAGTAVPLYKVLVFRSFLHKFHGSLTVGWIVARHDVLVPWDLGGAQEDTRQKTAWSWFKSIKRSLGLKPNLYTMEPWVKCLHSPLLPLIDALPSPVAELSSLSFRGK